MWPNKNHIIFKIQVLNKNRAQIFNPNIILKIVAIASEGVSNPMIQGS